MTTFTKEMSEVADREAELPEVAEAILDSMVDDGEDADSCSPSDFAVLQRVYGEQDLHKTRQKISSQLGRVRRKRRLQRTAGTPAERNERAADLSDMKENSIPVRGELAKTIQAGRRAEEELEKLNRAEADLQKELEMREQARAAALQLASPFAKAEWQRAKRDLNRDPGTVEMRELESRATLIEAVLRLTGKDEQQIVAHAERLPASHPAHPRKKGTAGGFRLVVDEAAWAAYRDALQSELPGVVAKRDQLQAAYKAELEALNEILE